MASLYDDNVDDFLLQKESIRVHFAKKPFSNKNHLILANIYLQKGCLAGFWFFSQTKVQLTCYALLHPTSLRSPPKMSVVRPLFHPLALDQEDNGDPHSTNTPERSERSKSNRGFELFVRTLNSQFRFAIVIECPQSFLVI